MAAEFDEFPDDAIPLALAPFATANIAEVVQDLILLTGAAEVAVNSATGRFSVWYPKTHMPFPGDPLWRDRWNPGPVSTSYGVDCGATFAPHELVEYPERFRSRFPVGDFEWPIVLSAVEIIWNNMLDALGRTVIAGDMITLARIGSVLTSTITEVPWTAWCNFVVEDWERGVATCDATNDCLANVPLAPQARKQPGPIAAEPLVYSARTQNTRNIEDALSGLNISLEEAKSGKYSPSQICGKITDWFKANHRRTCADDTILRHLGLKKRQPKRQPRQT